MNIATRLREITDKVLQEQAKNKADTYIPKIIQRMEEVAKNGEGRLYIEKGGYDKEILSNYLLRKKLSERLVNEGCKVTYESEDYREYLLIEW